MSGRRFSLEVVSPFRLEFTAWALRRRLHNAVDRWDGTSYRRIIVVQGRPLEAVVSQRPSERGGSLTVELRSLLDRPSLQDKAEATSLLRPVLGLDVDLSGFYRLARRDRRLSSLADRFRGMRPPRFPTVFEALVNAISCQQLSLTVGIHLLNRLATRYGPTLDGLDGPRGFPAPERLADADIDDLRGLGFSRAKARATVALASQVASGSLDLEALGGAGDDKVRAVLSDIGGVGRWSTEYAMLRGLGRLEVLPGDDVGAQNNLRRRYGLDASAGYDELSALARSWWPYGGLVYFHLLLDALADAGHIVPAAPVVEKRSASRGRAPARATRKTRERAGRSHEVQHPRRQPPPTPPGAQKGTYI